MIFVQRTDPPREVFDSDAFRSTRDALREYFSEYTRHKKQREFDWIYVAKVLRPLVPFLREMFRGKCAYCESRIDSSEPGLDHYRPQKGAKGAHGEYHDSHYWWLALEWENLLYACTLCMRFKATNFPVQEESLRASPLTYGDDLLAEQPLLLDPCSPIGHPEDHLLYDEQGTVYSKKERGSATIELLNLNREELIAGRQEAVQQMHQAFKDFQILFQSRSKVSKRNLAEYKRSQTQMINDIGDIYTGTTDLPFVGIRRHFLKAWFAQDPELLNGLNYWIDQFQGDTESKATSTVRGLADDPVGQDSVEEVETEGTETTTVEASQSLIIEHLHIRNFRNIVDLELSFPALKGEMRTPWLLLLGENAVGKSSVLQAVTLALMGREALDQEDVVKPRDVLRYFKNEDGDLIYTDSGFVEVMILGRSEPIRLEYQNDQRTFKSNFDGPGYPNYLLAYGPTRLLPDAVLSYQSSEGRVRAGNLFRASFPLVNVSSWLTRLSEENPEIFDYVVRGLRKMLLLNYDDDIRPHPQEPGEILIDIKHETTRIRSLSDGYRTILALAADIMYMVHRDGTSMDEAQGLVIIDEVGANLHPGWKKRIVSTFRHVFPHMQFLVTSHEPLCLRGLDEGEVALLRRDYADEIVAITSLPNPNDLRVDQLLTSEFFGLNTVLESDLEEIYNAYYKLLTKPSKTKADEKQIQELKEQLKEREHLGNSLRDELMYEVIDQLIAEQMNSRKPKKRTQLKKETVDRVLQAWKDSGLYDDTTVMS